MTAKWEQRLAEIGEGKAVPAAFMEQTKKLTTKIVQNAMEMAPTWDFTGMHVEEANKKNAAYSKGKTVGKCPLCEGNIIDKGKLYGCANYAKTNCSFTIAKKILGKNITQANIKKLLKTGETNLIKGFKKGEKVFDAKLIWQNGKIHFH